MHQVRLSRIESLADSILRAEIDAGYWNAKLRLEQTTAATPALKMLLDRGDPVQVKHIHLNGIPPGWQKGLEREISLGSESLLSTDLARAEARMQDLGWHLQRMPVPSLDESGSYHLSYSITKVPELLMEGAVGFNRASQTDSLIWIGNVNLVIPFFTEKGRRLELFWKRTSSDAEYLRFRYREPWLMNRPLALGVILDREVVNGEYQVLNLETAINWTASWDQEIDVILKRTESQLTFAGREANPQWKNEIHRIAGLGYRHADLVAAEDIRLGLRSRYLREISLTPVSLRQLSMRVELSYTPGNRISFISRGAGTLQGGYDASTDPSALLPLGGVLSVRGHLEEEVRAVNTVFMQNEFHIGRTSASGIFVFYDIGAYNCCGGWPGIQGYGLGMRFITQQRPITLHVAADPAGRLQNAFIHLSFEMGVPWIDR